MKTELSFSEEEKFEELSEYTDTEDDDIANELKVHMENDLNVVPSSRSSYVMGIGISFMSNFGMDSLKKEPFASFKGKKHKPTRELLEKELTLRGAKGHHKLNLDKLIDKLSDYPLKRWSEIVLVIEKNLKLTA